MQKFKLKLEKFCQLASSKPACLHKDVRCGQIYQLVGIREYIDFNTDERVLLTYKNVTTNALYEVKLTTMQEIHKGEFYVIEGDMVVFHDLLEVVDVQDRICHNGEQIFTIDSYPEIDKIMDIVLRTGCSIDEACMESGQGILEESTTKKVVTFVRK